MPSLVDSSGSSDASSEFSDTESTTSGSSSRFQGGGEEEERHKDNTHSSSSPTSFGNSFDGVHFSAFPVVTSLSVLTSEASHGAVDTACGLSLAGTR